MKNKPKEPIGIFRNGIFYKSFPTFEKQDGLSKADKFKYYMAFYRARERGETSIEFIHNNNTYIMKNI
jgi:hypothetical protein